MKEISIISIWFFENKNKEKDHDNPSKLREKHEHISETPEIDYKSY